MSKKMTNEELLATLGSALKQAQQTETGIEPELLRGYMKNELNEAGMQAVDRLLITDSRALDQFWQALPNEQPVKVPPLAWPTNLQQLQLAAAAFLGFGQLALAPAGAGFADSVEEPVYTELATSDSDVPRELADAMQLKIEVEPPAWFQAAQLYGDQGKLMLAIEASDPPEETTVFLLLGNREELDAFEVELLPEPVEIGAMDDLRDQFGTELQATLLFQTG